MSELVGNPEDRFSRAAAHICFSYAPVILVMHQSFVTMPTYIPFTVLLSLKCRGNVRVLTLGSLSQEDFYCEGQGKELDPQFVPWGVGLIAGH